MRHKENGLKVAFEAVKEEPFANGQLADGTGGRAISLPERVPFYVYLHKWNISGQ